VGLAHQTLVSSQTNKAPTKKWFYSVKQTLRPLVPAKKTSHLPKLRQVSGSSVMFTAGTISVVLSGCCKTVCSGNTPENANQGGFLAKICPVCGEAPTTVGPREQPEVGGAVPVTQPHVTPGGAEAVGLPTPTFAPATDAGTTGTSVSPNHSRARGGVARHAPTPPSKQKD